MPAVLDTGLVALALRWQRVGGDRRIQDWPAPGQGRGAIAHLEVLQPVAGPATHEGRELHIALKTQLAADDVCVRGVKLRAADPPPLAVVLDLGGVDKL